MQATNTIGYLLEHVADVLHRQSDQVLQERLGIGLSQYKILVMLLEQPGVEQRRLADSLGQTEASISRQVKLLQDKGMVTTHIDPEERRKHLATPTVKGVKLAEAAGDVLTQFQAPVLAGLNEKQQRLLLQMLHTVHEQTCAPGKRMACDRPGTIETIYDQQS